MDSSAPVKDKPNSEQRLGPQHETTEDTITRPSTAAAHTHGSGRSIGPQQSSEYACTSREDLQECSNTQSHELGQSNPSPSQPAEDCDPVPESFAQCKHWCTSAEPEETPDESPPQEEGSCDPCCECGENCHHNPFTDAVNLSVEKCLDKQECSFDRPNGEGLACCCMSCGASKAASRCSRCRQVPIASVCTLNGHPVLLRLLPLIPDVKCIWTGCTCILRAQYRQLGLGDFPIAALLHLQLCESAAPIPLPFNFCEVQRMGGGQYIAMHLIYRDFQRAG